MNELLSDLAGLCTELFALALSRHGKRENEAFEVWFALYAYLICFQARGTFDLSSHERQGFIRACGRAHVLLCPQGYIFPELFPIADCSCPWSSILRRLADALATFDVTRAVADSKTGAAA